MYSVLMSVYDKESPANLSQALYSLSSQTLPPGEIVLVKDGLLTEDLEQVITEFKSRFGLLKVVPIKKNVGLGKALNLGLTKCEFHIVGRMDSDDISLPHRFERQVKWMIENEHVDVLGCWISEFFIDEETIITQRKVPEKHEEIVQFAKSRCPVNHPAVVFKKDAVFRAGGYMHFPFLEDYFLWYRMLKGGAKFYNLQESLLLYRATPEMYKRRGGASYAANELRLFLIMRKDRFISIWKLMFYVPVRLCIRLLPSSIRGIVYNMLRKFNL